MGQRMGHPTHSCPLCGSPCHPGHSRRQLPLQGQSEILLPGHCHSPGDCSGFPSTPARVLRKPRGSWGSLVEGSADSVFGTPRRQPPSRPGLPRQPPTQHSIAWLRPRESTPEGRGRRLKRGERPLPLPEKALTLSLNWGAEERTDPLAKNLPLLVTRVWSSLFLAGWDGASLMWLYAMLRCLLLLGTHCSPGLEWGSLLPSKVLRT